MPLTTEQRELVLTELKNIGSNLNLSEDQKQRLQSFLSDASEKIAEYKRQNPNVSTQDILKQVSQHRAEIRQRLVNFLTPEQLAKWDSEVAKAKAFLGQAAA